MSILIGSRQLMVASLICIFIGIYLRTKKSRKRKCLSYFLLIISSLLIYFIYDNFQSIILRSENFESALDQYIDRIDYWRKGIKLGLIL